MQGLRQQRYSAVLAVLAYEALGSLRDVGGGGGVGVGAKQM